MPTPTFNKYKSTTIYGNLSVRDLTNSSGSSVIEVASVDLSGNFLSRGDSTFTKKVLCNALLADISGNNCLTTKEYVDNAVSTGGGEVLLSSDNEWSGTNFFTNHVDISGNFSATGNNTFNKKVICNANIEDLTTGSCLTTKEYVITYFGEQVLNLRTTNNTWSGLNQFYTYLPRSNLGAGAIVSTECFLTKGLMDNIYGRKENLNAWSGENTFNSYLPTSTLTPTSASQLTTKTYVDGRTYLLSNTNDFSSTNTFNSYFPTSTLPTSTIINGYTIVNKQMNDILYSSKTNEVKTNTANAFTSTNTFNSYFPTSTLPNTTIITQDSIVNIQVLDTLYGGMLNQNIWEGQNTFNDTILQPINSFNQDRTLPSGAINKFIYTNFLELVEFGKGISQAGTDTNTLDNLTIATNLTLTNGSITQSAGSTTNTLKNLKVDTIATIPATLTNITQDYSSVKMRNYIFHSRTATNASGITLSTNTYIDDGQYLYVRKINSGSYTLTLTAGTSTTFLNLSNASVSTIAITGLTGVSFIYDKTNTRWIQLT